MTTEERRAIEERVRSAISPYTWDEALRIDGPEAHDIEQMAHDLDAAEADRAALLAALQEAEATVARQRRAIYRIAALVHEVLARDVEAAAEAQSVREFRSVSRIRARLAKLEEGGRRE